METNPNLDSTNPAHSDSSDGDSSPEVSFALSHSFVENADAAKRADPILPRFDDVSDRTVLNLAHKSAMIVEAFPDRIPNARELEDMSRAFGPDLVTMALLKIISGVSPNSYFLERVDRVYRDLKLASRDLPKRAETAALVPKDERAELCVIESVDPFTPKSKWGAHVETWRSWGRRQGLTTDVIQTEKHNSLMANAEIIRRELQLQPHDRRIIATVGQGGAEFRLLVEQLLKTAPHELSGIQMWINVAGLVRGGSGIELKRRGFWNRKALEFSTALRGWPRSIALQLSHLNPRLAAEPNFQGLPFVCVSMVGFPSMGDVPTGLKGNFLAMSARGPNDGLATFHESVIRPGYIVPVPGMSHRAEPERLGPWFQAVVSAFTFDREPHASNDRNPPTAQL